MPECFCEVGPVSLGTLLRHPLYDFMFQIVHAHRRSDGWWSLHIRSPLVGSVGSDGRMPMMRAVVLDGDTLSFPEEDYPFEC
jgi:hypothetical protein